MIVVDANIAVKWYVPEAGSEAALDLMSGPDLLYAPELIRIEVLAAISRRSRTDEASRQESANRCENWLRHLQNGAVTLLREQDLLDDALSLSFEIRHNLQDCLYLAAARRLEVHLITADRLFRERAASHYSLVTLLGECSTN